ncbi:MAG: LCP family protein [Candidatus Margulisbacteria bacterium]|jgi:LCP family protein required for cell wall assembly|nr:LCP family protein [Candidatus Margulisiibacteriota bacterium]
MFTKTQKRILICIAVISILSALIGLFFSANIQSFGTVLKIFTMSLPQRQFTSNTNILVMGIDGGAQENIHRADSIMVVNINPYTKYIGVLSIPRDCRLPVPGHGQIKINHAYAYGGAKLTREALSNYLQIPIPYYVELDMQGVAELVDQIGGVPLNVERRMYYVDRAGDLYIDLYPGYQVLDGSKALQYVRFRSDARADLGRIDRQQKFIQAVGNKALRIGVIFKAPTMIYKMAKYARTNVPASRFVDLAKRVREAYQLGHLDIATIPSEPVYINGIAYLQPDWAKTQELVRRVIHGYEFTTPALPPVKKPPELSIEVLNGSGKSGMGRNAVAKLKYLGYQTRDAKDASRFDYKETIILNWHGAALEDEAYILARKLYINPDNIIVRTQNASPVSFSLIVGHDWPLER